MKKAIFLVGVLAIFVTPNVASAGPIETACNRSFRQAANPPLCSCIQQVANMTLRSSDQRRAAKLLNDPDKAHKTWMSKRSGDDAFWDRYTAFGDQAQALCSSS
jgi:hypothetical protein